MKRCVLRFAAGVLLVGVAVAVGCGGGAGSWSVQGDEGAWLVDMTIDTSGCAPTIFRQFGADVEEINSTRSRVVIHLESFLDCLARSWELSGTWISSSILDMDDLTNAYVCQFEDRWDIELFSISGLTLDFPGGGTFSGNGSFSATIDGGPCTGTITFFGMER